MKRILSFFLAFLAVAAVLLGSIYLWNRDAFQTLFNNREGMAEGSEWIGDTYSLSGLVDYVRLNPGPVTVASYVVDRTDSLLAILPDAPRPMGNLGNLILMMAYADAFHSGVIDSNATLPWTEVGRWQIPGVLEPAHRSLDREVERMLDADGGLRFADALRLLPIHGDLALSDWLLNRYGREAMAAFIDTLGLEATEPLVPQSGVYLMASTLDPATFRQRYDPAAASPDDPGAILAARRELHDLAWQAALAFASNDGPSQALRERIDKERLGLTFMQERDALTLFPMSTAGELTRLMAGLADASILPKEASTLVIDWLSWPLENAEIRRDFTRYGALYDSRIGLLSGVDFGTSRYTGDTTIQSVIFDRLPVGFWFHLSANHMHQDFQQRLIYDPALIASVRSAISSMELAPTSASTTSDSPSPPPPATSSSNTPANNSANPFPNPSANPPAKVDSPE